MNTLLLMFGVFFVSLPASAGSWHKNTNAGFSVYVPEGWQVSDKGRSTSLTGPEREATRSHLFIGSDWDSRIDGAKDLPLYAKTWTGTEGPFSSKPISGLVALSHGDAQRGANFVFREAMNVIVIDFDLRGSKEQIRDGHEILGSIEIQTGGLFY